MVEIELLPWDGVSRLKWTEPREPNREIGYNHIIAETPFGRFVLTWKGWKEDFRQGHGFDETPWDGVEYPLVDRIDEFKEWAEVEMWKRVHQFLAGAEQTEQKEE